MLHSFSPLNVLTKLHFGKQMGTAAASAAAVACCRPCWRRLVALSEHPPMNVAMDTCQHLAPGETSFKNRTHYDTIQKLTEGGGFWSWTVTTSGGGPNYFNIVQLCTVFLFLKLSFVGFWPVGNLQLLRKARTAAAVCPPATLHRSVVCHEGLRRISESYCGLN